MSLATLTTQAVSEIAPTTAKANGTITATGNGNCSKRGFVYSLASHGDPGNVVPDASGYEYYAQERASFWASTFFIELSSLAKNTKYYVRSYAYNASGYSYGDEVNFTTLERIYPDEIYSPRTKINKDGVNYDSAQTDKFYSPDITKLDDEVVAIETELGVNPRGVYASIAAFLSDLLSKVISAFTDLPDVPASYGGQAGKFLKVNGDENALIFAAGGGGVSAHTDLTDKEVNGVIDHALKSVRDGHLYNFSALKRLLATQPNKALEIVKKIFTGAGGQNKCLALTFDGTYLYAGLETSPAKVLKIDPSTMTIVATWTAGAGDNVCTSLTFDGTYIYAGIYIAGTKVFQIDRSTMATVQTWTGAAGEDYCRALTFDGTYVYAGLYTHNAKVVQINPANMTTVAVWTGLAEQDNCAALTFDGTYIYAGLYIGFAEVIQIDPSNMTTLGIWTGTLYGNFCRALAFDGYYIYAALDVAPGVVVKINPSTMLAQNAWPGGVLDDNCESLTFDGTFIYVSCLGPTARIIKIDPSTMLTLDKYIGAIGENECSALTSDGTFIYAGLYLSPVQILRLMRRNVSDSENFVAAKAVILNTTRAIYGNNFNGSAALTQIIGSAYGGTGNGFAKISGPATAEKTFTLPNASAKIITDQPAEISGLTDKATPLDADVAMIESDANSNAKRKLTWANIKITLKAYFDTLYCPKGITTLRTTSNQTINAGAATFVDITGLTFPVVNGVSYAFEFYIVFQSAAAATGWKAGVNCPTGTLDFWADSEIIANGAAGVATHTKRHNTVRDDMTLLTTTVTQAVDLAITIKGRYLCTQDGTFAARFANELAADTNIVVQKGSWGIYF